MKKLKLFLSLSLAIVLLFAQAGFSRNLSAESISSSADVLQTEASASEEPTLATLSETELVSTPVDEATVAVSEVTETSTEVSNLVNESTASSTDTSSSETLPNTEETPSGALDPLTDLTPLEESQDNPLAMAELQMMPLALATGEIQIAVTNMVLENQDYMRAQYYEFHPLSFDWTHTGQVTAGQYFTIKIDPELNLHPNTLDQLPDLKYLETVIATPTVDIGTGTVTYTFNKQAEGLADFSGHVQINVSIKGPGDGVTFRDVNGDGINDVDANGNYKAGTKQTIHITVGDQVEAILITHIGFPTVPESIFNVNSWMNTNVLEHSIPWDPSIKGDFIQAFVEVTRNDQYQDKSLQINPPARDTKLHVFSAIDVGPFVVEAGVRITQMDGVWNLPTQTVTYTKTSTKYFSYADLGYTPGSDNFTVDFASLGYDNPKKPETTYNVEYFVHHKGSITYKDANGNSNNMASLTYFAD